jgi:class 3 adenylate cyclase
MTDDHPTKSTELEEARAHLAATREVLNVISSSRGKLQPVLDLIVSTATRLCEADYSLFFQDFGDGFVVTASDNARPEVISYYNANPLLPTHGTIVGRAALTKAVVHIPDFLADPDHNTPDRRRIAAIRTGLGVPLVQDGQTIAVMTVLRTEAKPFTDRHIKLVETFSEQATIAIDNASLVEQLEHLNFTLEKRVQEQVDELERIGRLRRFLPPQLAEMVISSGDETILERHRREVGVVFCDLRGFTAFSEVAEPEEVTQVLEQYHAVAGPLIEKHGGTLERFLGDGLMVIFNDPLPCEDPAQRAVRLAVDVRNAMQELTADWQSQGYDVGFGVGISYGFATIGRIGFEGRSDYTAIGSVVNQAARLCDEAGAGEILITQRIANIAKGFISAEPLGDLALKGLRQPVRAFRLLALGQI